MGRFKRTIRRLKVRYGSLSRTKRIAAAALAALIAVGALWLVLAAGRTDPLIDCTESVPTSDAPAASVVLDREGVDHVLDGSRLLVTPADLGRARTTIASAGLAPVAASDTFERLAGESDIWRTDAQNEKRWQAAKMSALSRLISAMPGIESATVLIEPGRERRLGQPGVAPGAAVHVKLSDTSPMSHNTALAIRELVAGSVPALDSGDVCLVDDAGRSYGSDGSAGNQVAERLAAATQAEAHYAEKVRAALRHQPGASVSVRVAADGPTRRPVAATVLLPRLRTGAGDGGPAAQAAELETVRRAVAHVLGMDDAEAVLVDWYRSRDGADETTPADAPPIGWAAAGAGAIALVGVAWAFKRRAGRRAKDAGTPPADEDTSADRARDAGPFGFLEGARPAEVAALLAGERAQTTAVVLSRLPAPQAGAVLAALPAPVQIDSARRIAQLDDADPELIDDLAEALYVRYQEMSAERSGGAAGLADILRHAGHAAETQVLRGLDGETPAPAGTIRRRVVVFEDVVDLPVSLLRAAADRLGSVEVAIALRTAGEGLKSKILKSLPPGISREVRRQMDHIGPVRLSDVEDAQQRIVEAIRRVSDGSYVGEPGLGLGSHHAKELAP